MLVYQSVYMQYMELFPTSLYGVLFLGLYPIYKSAASRDIQSADSMTGAHQWPSWQCIGARNILQPHEICNVISLVSTYIWVDNPDINTLSETHFPHFFTPWERTKKCSNIKTSASPTLAFHTKTPPLAALHLVPKLQLTMAVYPTLQVKPVFVVSTT